MQNLMKGFTEIIPQRSIAIFDPKEVEVSDISKIKSEK